MNRYLARKRDQYEALRTSIEGIQTRAADNERDLTEDELRSVTDQAEEARKVAAEIESLTEVETRNRKVAELAAEVSVDDAEQTRTGATQTRDRDPGHYTRSSEHSFFRDLHRARMYSDESAQRRLAQHTRALDTTNEGPGVLPPNWLTEEFEQLAYQGRRVASAVRNIPLGDDPRPLTLPRQSAGTGTVVGEVAENTAPTSTDAWDSATTVVTPKAFSGIQVVSRFLLDQSMPAIDQLIYSDMVAAYNQDVEAEVVSAMVTAAGTAQIAYATEAEWDTAIGNTQVSDDLVTLAIAVRDARKLPGDIVLLAVQRYGDLLKMKDSSGRPLMPLDTAGPMNVIGVGSPQVDGRVHGLGIIATDGIQFQTYPESIVAARAADTLLFESNLLRFRYEEPVGPQSIKLGVWGYAVAHVKHDGKSTKRNEITAA